MKTEVNPAMKPLSPFRRRLHEIVFESGTFGGRAFDFGLIVLILVSSLVVVFESVPSIEAQYYNELVALEWVFTGLFTLEYLLRLASLNRPWLYMTSFFGIIDLLSILPMYLSLFLGGFQALLVIRLLRLIRLFRLFKMVRYIAAAETLVVAFKMSLPKITVFLVTIFAIVVMIGSLFYIIESHTNPKVTSIPDGIYWAIATITTVGYGDVVPQTHLGRVVAGLLMIIGFGVFAVPTGIVSVQLAKAMKLNADTGQACQSCGRGGHDVDARFCKHCGGRVV